MNYEELVEKALRGRSIAAMAREWGLNQPTLHRYVKGGRLPDYDTALKMAKEAGVDPTVAFEALAAEERVQRVKNFKLQMGFVQTDLLLSIATLGVLPLLYIM